MLLYLFVVHCFSSAVLLNRIRTIIKKYTKKHKIINKIFEPKKIIMDKCETRTTILSNLFHVITKSDTYALLIRLSSISTNGCSKYVDNFKPWSYKARLIYHLHAKIAEMGVRRGIDRKKVGCRSLIDANLEGQVGVNKIELYLH